jgi:hypothetical protein
MADIPNQLCDVPEKPMGPRDEAEVEGFVKWVERAKGARVAEACREMLNDPQYLSETPQQILVRARSEIHQEDLQAVAVLANSSCQSDCDVDSSSE